MSDKFRWSGQNLTVEALTSFARDVARDADYSTARFMNAVQVHIIVHFLGIEWYRQYAFIGAKRNSYLSPDRDVRNDTRMPIYSMRILNLAEMLFNLQEVEGFGHPLVRIASGQIESSMAELQLGMMLYQAHRKIRYVNSDTNGGRSCDLKIEFENGATSCGEIKCKEDTTDISVETITNSLDDARGQLPKGGDGIIFVKVPQGWAAAATDEQIFLRMEIIDAARTFLRNTSRVALIVFYIFHLQEFSWGVRNRHAIREFPTLRNPHEYPWGRNLFPFDLPTKWVSMPSLVQMWSESR
jgi:hypothetical protein